MKGIVIAFFIFLPIFGFCQSIVYCPEIQTEAREGFDNFHISLVFNDLRTYTQKPRKICPKNKIYSQFVNFIKETYPNIKITVLDENRFYESPDSGKVTFKINFTKYDVTLHKATGTFVANTKYEATIFDYRVRKMIIKDTFSGEARVSNSLPSGGRIASNSSFESAFDKFLTMFEKLNP